MGRALLGLAVALAVVDANPYGHEPYPVFWAVNGPNASAFAPNGAVNIAQYGIKTNNYTICGGMTGALMPSLSPDGAPIRGGVPQSANFSLDAFLSGLSKALTTRIPDAQYDGLAVFDFEKFTPIWSEDTSAGGWHSKAYRVYSMKLVQQAHPSWSRAEVEAEAKSQFEAAAIQLFVSALEQGKKLRPKALWGFYGMREPLHQQLHWLHVVAVNKVLAVCHVATLAAAIVHSGSNASKLLPIWKASRALFPSIYISSPKTAKSHVESTIALSLKMAEKARHRSSGKGRIPVYPFGWECCERAIVSRLANSGLHIVGVIEYLDPAMMRLPLC